MKVSDFDFNLPDSLIATEAVERGESKMMVLSKLDESIVHSNFSNIDNFIDENTTVVFNATKVIPARLFGKRSTGGMVEFLLVKDKGNGIWETMTKSSKRLKDGEVITISEGVSVKVIAKTNSLYNITFELDGKDIYNYLFDQGDIPLPPYILKQRGEKRSRPEDKQRYQTVYADRPGSVAAPTAGLHFNDKIIDRIRDKTNGRIEYIFLDVGLGTFLPVKTDDIKNHKMHSESYFIPKDVAIRLNEDKRMGRKILAVGTTTIRALETASNVNSEIESGKGESSIFIYPGYEYKFVDQVVTNFHLPKSTLLMMISAMIGKTKLMHAYNQAIENKYRFYSYGDGMLIL